MKTHQEESSQHMVYAPIPTTTENLFRNDPHKVWIQVLWYDTDNIRGIDNRHHTDEKKISEGNGHGTEGQGNSGIQDFNLWLHSRSSPDWYLPFWSKLLEEETNKVIIRPSSNHKV